MDGVNGIDTLGHAPASGSDQATAAAWQTAQAEAQAAPATPGQAPAGSAPASAAPTPAAAAPQAGADGWVYHQRTGELTHNGQHVATGYSGSGAGQNNPDTQSTPNVGPVPQGDYTIGHQFNSHATGPGAMRLTPQAGTATYGRSDFEVHGDSTRHPGQASQGCIILPPGVRHEMATSGDTTLHVQP